MQWMEQYNKRKEQEKELAKAQKGLAEVTMQHIGADPVCHGLEIWEAWPRWGGFHRPRWRGVLQRVGFCLWFCCRFCEEQRLNQVHDSPAMCST